MQVNLSSLITAQSLRSAPAQQPRVSEAKAAPTEALTAGFEPLPLGKPISESAARPAAPAKPGVRLGSQLDIKV